MAFELYATGQYTLVRLRELLNAKGLRSVKNRTMTAFRYQYLLQNPFYYGVFVLNGEMHQGAHEPLVTKDLFDKVQEVMTRRSKPNSVRLTDSSKIIWIPERLACRVSSGWGDA